MILREIFYFDKETIEPVEDKRYSEKDDQSPVDFDSTRKTRLTLRHRRHLLHRHPFLNQPSYRLLDLLQA